MELFGTVQSWWVGLKIWTATLVVPANLIARSSCLGRWAKVLTYFLFNHAKMSGFWLGQARSRAVSMRWRHQVGYEDRPRVRAGIQMRVGLAGSANVGHRLQPSRGCHVGASQKRRYNRRLKPAATMLGTTAASCWLRLRKGAHHMHKHNLSVDIIYN